MPFVTPRRTRTWAYIHGTGGLLASIHGPLPGTGDTALYTYNSQDFLQTTTDEVGQVTYARLASLDPNCLGKATSVQEYSLHWGCGSPENG